MRIVVFSDSHGDFSSVHAIVRQQNHADVFICLGDGLQELQDLSFAYPDKAFFKVRGNNDYSWNAPVSELYCFEGIRVFATHGHTYCVKAGLQQLLQAARDQKADIVLFGHTHQGFTSYQDGLYILNPGSARGLSPSLKRTYGIVDITPQGIVTNIIPVRL